MLLFEHARKNKNTPEQQAVANLSKIAQETLALPTADTQTLEDGTVVRTIGETFPGHPQFTETTTPDGAKRYEYQEYQIEHTPEQRDRGIGRWTWQEGDDKVHYSAHWEVSGEEEDEIRDKATLEQNKIGMQKIANSLRERAMPKRRGKARRIGSKIVRSLSLSIRS